MIYAVGDIHGQSEALDRALRLIEADGGDDAEIVFLGDYTDRGPDSRGVLDRLIGGLEDGRNWTCIAGNHDRMFRNYLAEGLEHDARIKSGLSWLNPRLGGLQTLASYGLLPDGGPAFLLDAQGREVTSAVHLESGEHAAEEYRRQARAAVPEEHLQFLATRPHYHEAGELLFVHAGIRPGIPMEDQHIDDLLWIREGFLEDERDHGPLVVHGHTALDTPDHFGNRVNLDGGAGYGRPLVPAVFEGRDCWLLTDDGRQRLEPAL